MLLNAWEIDGSCSDGTKKKKRRDFVGFNPETGAETVLLETRAGMNISLMYILASFSVCKNHKRCHL